MNMYLMTQAQMFLIFGFLEFWEVIATSKQLKHTVTLNFSGFEHCLYHFDNRIKQPKNKFNKGLAIFKHSSATIFRMSL